MLESGGQASLPSRIATLVHAHFDALPSRSKPSIFPDGSREWIPMTGIVVVVGENTPSESLHCISITSGAKCLAASHIPRCRGLVLHDCHAEILAIRAFNHWLLAECHSLITEERSIEVDRNSIPTQEKAEQKCQKAPTSIFIRRRESKGNEETKWPPFELQPNIKIYMYCTCAPCGDASMELCMASQEDATPWEVMSEKTEETDTESPDKMLDGRAHFSLLGVVRRKPARMDAESTRSKSCSDKLALRQVSSLLSCETSRLVAPTESAYLAGLILPEDEISQSGCERSFGENGRMKDLAGRSWPAKTSVDQGEPEIGYRFRPFQILSVSAEQIETQWRFAKMKKDVSSLSTEGSEEVKTAAGPKKNRPSNVSAIWTAAPSYSHSCALLSDMGNKSLPSLNRTKTGLYENVINGVKQGNRATTPLARGASSLSRAKLWALVRNIVQPSACEGLLSSTQQEELPGAETDRLDEGFLGLMRQQILQPTTYEKFKQARIDSMERDPNKTRAEAIKEAKIVLKGWVPNLGDEYWGLDVLVDPQKRKR